MAGVLQVVVLQVSASAVGTGVLLSTFGVLQGVVVDRVLLSMVGGL